MTARKLFVGGRVRRLREGQGMSQAVLAESLGISPSYLNQIERNHRPLTASVLVRLNATFDLDLQLFSDDDEERLVGDLRDVLVESEEAESVTLSELKDLVADMPQIAKVILAFHDRARVAEERVMALAQEDRRDDPALPRQAMTPYEEVRDYFYERRNHVDVLDTAAEQLFVEDGLTIGFMDEQLPSLLRARHGVRVVLRSPCDMPAGTHRVHDVSGRVLNLSRVLSPGQRAFQMATQLAFLAHERTFDDLVRTPRLGSEESRSLARIGLAHYFAGALLLPYSPFQQTATALKHDIDQLGTMFGVGFETVCHRLSTLQRPNAQGVPFFLVRVDQAGNISKRQSATDFHFSRVGGSCPLWAVYDAFATPGRLVRQMARMPDGRTYLWIARTIRHHPGPYGVPGKVHAIGLGCDIRYVDRLVYGAGLDTQHHESAVPIGPGCKVCERPVCPQRAFPPIGRPIVVDRDRGCFQPYRSS